MLFNNSQELVEIINKIRTEQNLTVMDSIIYICEKYGIEEEAVAVYIRQSHKIKEELRQEAIQLKMVKDDSN